MELTVEHTDSKVKSEKVIEEWELKKIGEIAPLQRGYDLPKSKIIRGKHPVVYSNGVESYHHKYIDKGPGVVTGRSGTLGNVTYIEQDYWPHNTSLWVTNFNGNHPRFIYYLYTFIKIDRFGSGSGVPTLNRNDVHDYEVIIPESNKEQQAIAGALSDVDALIAELDALIQKKQQIKKGAMQQLLTGKKRLPGFDGEWRKEKIKDISDISTGGKNTEDKIDDGKYPFFVRSSQIERINTYSFDGEAVLTAGDGVNTGKIFHYINGKFDYHQRVYKISNFLGEVDGYYFYLYFSEHFYDRVMRMTAKSSVDSVRYDMIGEMKVELPSIDEQKTIAQILSDMDAEIQSLQAKRSKYQKIKQGMMQELLTGKTRLV